MAAAVDRLKCGVVSYGCLMGKKKCKSLQLKLKSVVVEFRACFLLMLKVRRSFPWPKSSMPFCISAVSESFLLMLPSASISRENISPRCGTSTYPFTFSKRKRHASKASLLLTSSYLPEPLLQCCTNLLPGSCF